MIESGINPDDVTLISLVFVWCRAGMVTKRLDYCHRRKLNYRIIQNLKHYACVVDLLSCVGKSNEAHEFIERMPIKLDPTIWGALLNACRIHRQLLLGELIVQHIFKEDAESIGYYILLCTLYANGGKWDEVAKVRRTMILSGDNFHPQMEEITIVLEGFYEKMKASGFNSQESSLIDEIKTSKADIFYRHSERQAIAYSLINTVPRMPTWVTSNNLYMCQICHTTVKFIFKIIRREMFPANQKL